MPAYALCLKRSLISGPASREATIVTEGCPQAPHP